MDKNKACVFSSRTDKHRTGKKSKEKLEKEQTGLTNTASGTEASSWWKPFAKKKAKNQQRKKKNKNKNLYHTQFAL